MSYYNSKTLQISFDEAIARVTEALQSEGIGILTEIDVQAILKRAIVKSCGSEVASLAWEGVMTSPSSR